MYAETKAQLDNNNSCVKYDMVIFVPYFEKYVCNKFYFGLIQQWNSISKDFHFHAPIKYYPEGKKLNLILLT